MAHLNPFPKIKEDILSKSPLKLRDLSKEDIPEKNVEDFLRKFFTDYNQKLDTVYAANGRTQTRAGLRRSIEDIFKIVHYYFPKVSLTKFYPKLLDLVEGGVIVSAICEVIHKRVYRAKTKYDKSNFFNGDLIDEYGTDFTMFEMGEHITNNVHGWGTDYTKQQLNIKTL